MKNYIVAIVGRTNVGKSTLFNKMVGKRQAILSPEAGTTRDFLYGDAEWQGTRFTIVDTAGAEGKRTEPLASKMVEQVNEAITHADIIIFMVDGKDGLQPLDADVAKLLRKKQNQQPVLLVANKYDTRVAQGKWGEFEGLGFGAPIQISANTGRGVGDLLDKVVESFKKTTPKTESSELNVFAKIAILGKPNVGKSTLFNKLVGRNRSIVSSVAGTTRDSVNEIIKYHGNLYELVDTAGLRRVGKIDSSVEKFSVLRSLRALRYADLALILVDGSEGMSAQDKHIFSAALKENKAIVLLINKWDLVEKDQSTLFKYERYLEEELSFAKWIPKLFVSALTGQRLDKLFSTIDTAITNYRKEIPTKQLNTIIEAAYIKNPPKGKISGKVYYAKQSETEPPTFQLTTSQLLHTTYLRYLENILREKIDFTGTPIRVVTVQRNKK